MAKRSPIWEKYGKPSAANSDYQVLTCPQCEGKEFDSLTAWKYHMQAEHGGYTSDDISESLPPGGDPHADQTESAAGTVKPKKVTARARELNDKFNEGLNLLFKHFIDGLTDADKIRLFEIREEVSSAVIGVEFDFEERLVKISSKVALGIAVTCLWVLPQIPSFKEIIAKAKENADKSKSEKA
jgi:hypothetical protein